VRRHTVLLSPTFWSSHFGFGLSMVPIKDRLLADQPSSLRRADATRAKVADKDKDRVRGELQKATLPRSVFAMGPTLAPFVVTMNRVRSRRHADPLVMPWLQLPD
jgi:hypothetical protein